MPPDVKAPERNVVPLFDAGSNCLERPTGDDDVAVIIVPAGSRHRRAPVETDRAGAVSRHRPYVLAVNCLAEITLLPGPLAADDGVGSQARQWQLWLHAQLPPRRDLCDQGSRQAQRDEISACRCGPWSCLHSGWYSGHSRGQDRLADGFLDRSALIRRFCKANWWRGVTGPSRNFNGLGGIGLALGAKAPMT